MTDPMMKVVAGAIESRSSTGYRWNNAVRQNAHVILQVTTAGYCYFREGNKVTTVDKGKAFIAIPPEDTQYWYPKEAAKPYHLEWLTFSGEPVISLARMIRQRHGAVVSMGKNSETLLLFRRILKLFQTAKFRDRYQECEMIHALLMSVLREQARQEQDRDPIVFCFNYIHDHHRSSFNIKNLAADVGISREHMTREFARRYDQPPAAMLRKLRLQTAMNQLLSSTQSLDNIARSSGLTCARTLSRLFARETGRSPEHFRRKHNQK